MGAHLVSNTRRRASSLPTTESHTNPSHSSRSLAWADLFFGCEKGVILIARQIGRASRSSPSSNMVRSSSFRREPGLISGREPPNASSRLRERLTVVRLTPNLRAVSLLETPLLTDSTILG